MRLQRPLHTCLVLLVIVSAIFLPEAARSAQVARLVVDKCAPTLPPNPQSCTQDLPTASVSRPFDFYVWAVDSMGQRVTSYQGTVRFTSSDLAAILPSTTTFSSGDLGARFFEVVFQSTGIVPGQFPGATTELVEVFDDANGLRGGYAINVLIPAQLSLDPPVPVAGRAFTVTLTGGRLCYPPGAGSTNTLVSGNEITIQHDYPHDTPFQIDGCTDKVELGHLAPGRYRLVWLESVERIEFFRVSMMTFEVEPSPVPLGQAPPLVGMIALSSVLIFRQRRRVALAKS